MKTHAFLEIAAAILLVAGGIWFLATKPLDDRLDAMLPQEPTLLKALRMIEETRLSGRVIVHVRAATPDYPHVDFVTALDRLVVDLQLPMISRIVTPASTMPTPADIQDLATIAPQLLDAETYTQLEQRLDAAGIRQSLATIRRMMLSPQSFPMTTWFRRDPLGARALALRPLELLGKAKGFQMTIADGHFFSEDLQAAMLILETPVRITDHAGSVVLIDGIRAALTRLPSGLEASIIAGHLHTLSNQSTIRRDIGWTGLLATLFFGGLFFIQYRDLRSIIIFVIPTMGILMGLAVVGWTGVRLAAVVVGMCSMLAGIAIDYGIHVYVALTYPEAGRTRKEAVRLILRSLWLSALTTIIPIAALMLSTIPGYRQLGLLGSSAILFSLLLATRIMPLFFPRNLDLRGSPVRMNLDRTGKGLSAKMILSLFLVLFAGAIILAAGIDVDLDFKRLNGAAETILRDEEAFFAKWGRGPFGMGIVAVWDQDPEIARQANDAIYHHVAAAGVEGYVSIAPVSPSDRSRRENAARWISFWNQHGNNVKAELARIGPEYGFAEDAFDPFFASLYDGTDPAVFATDNRLLAMLEKQFVSRGDERFTLLSFYPDMPEFEEILTNLPDTSGEHMLISQRGLQARFASSILYDLARQASIAFVLITILIAVLVRRLRTILLMTMPPFSGAVGMLAGLRLVGQPLTPTTILAGFLMAGICFDYGVFMLQAWQRGVRREITRGIHLAWMTTAGAASLLLVAKHPVLHSTGLALSLGVTSGYVTARWVLWEAARILRVPTTQGTTE